MKTLKKLLFLLSAHERKRAALLLLMILIMAFLDMLGVASIMPFIAVLTNPSLVETNYILNFLFQASGTFGVETNEQFLFFLGVLIFAFLVISLTFKALTTYAQLRFVQMRQYSIGKRLMENYLHQPYSWFLGRHSQDLGKSILSEVTTIIGSGMGPMMELIAKSTVTIALLILVTITSPKLALITGFTLFIAYTLIYKFTRGYLKRIGLERLKANKLRFTSLNDAFGAAKEVKVGGLEQFYINQFSASAKLLAKNQAASQIISQMPRYALEAIGFGGMLLLILYIMSDGGTLATALPIIALYAFAGYRLMPAIQKIYSSIAILRFAGPAIDALYDDIKGLQSFNLNQDQEVLKFNKSITLNHIHYNYPNTSRTALKDISLNIPAQSRVAFVGTTGSGKTTTVDIILGLLEPQQGTLEVDGQAITKNNNRAWQRSIGYVPQHIYLVDDTITANIAFGIEQKKINLEAVEKAAKIANLHDFVIDELPKKYQTEVGERGIRLSGGQRQRIGIARALYHNPKILILDEATSSLDNSTEKDVMNAINNINNEITVILIAHRLDTIKKCNLIFQLSQGKIIGQGSYESFINKDPNFNLVK
jgi:ATP-binding cassette, subfamily B, bacterial PglK